MKYFEIKRSLMKGKLEYNCVFSYKSDQDKIILHLCDPVLGELDFIGYDLFDAFNKVRLFLEKKGFLLLCAGSMPNVYPSGMLRDRTNGRMAYLHTYEKKLTIDDTIDIFKQVDQHVVGTIEEQSVFMSNFHSYFKNLEIMSRMEVTDEIVEEAKKNPNGWVYKIDKNYDLSGDIPGKAIVGAWRVDEYGNIILDSYIVNKNYISLDKP